jgi:hypothetical protein
MRKESSVFGAPTEWWVRADSNRPERQCRRAAANPEVGRPFPSTPSLRRSSTKVITAVRLAPERFRIIVKVKLEERSSGATRSAS